MFAEINGTTLFYKTLGGACSQRDQPCVCVALHGGAGL